MSKKRQRAERQGHVAETLALWFLLLKFYWPVAQRAKTPKGEIDLIVRRGRQLVLVEVKARQHMQDAAEAILPQQQRRIIDAFSLWVARHPRYMNCHTRCDVILIAPWRWPRHITNAFSL